MQETEYQQSTDFTFEELQEYIGSEDYRKDQIKKFVENQRMIKLLSKENISLLNTISDKEKSERLFNAVSTAHLIVLENQVEDISMKSVLKDSFVDMEELQFLLENGNKSFRRSLEIMKQHQDNPVQKRLIKEKHLTKRKIKKSGTAFNHLETLHDSKKSCFSSDKISLLMQIQESMMADQELLAQKYNELLIKTNNNTSDVEEIKERLSSLEDKVKDPRKRELFVLKTSDKNFTTAQIADMLKVSHRTVKYWIKELKGAGVLH